MNKSYQKVYNKYLCYPWIQGPIIPKITKGSNRSSSNRFLHIATNQSLKFTFTTCTSTTNFNLVWDNFIDFF